MKVSRDKYHPLHIICGNDELRILYQYKFIKPKVGGSPDFLVKPVFEIAVSQPTRTRDHIFVKFVDPNRPPVPAIQSSPYLVQFWLNYAKSPKHSLRLFGEVKSVIIANRDMGNFLPFWHGSFSPLSIHIPIYIKL